MQPNLQDPGVNHSEDQELWGREMAERLNSAEKKVGSEEGKDNSQSIADNEQHAGANSNHSTDITPPNQKMSGGNSKSGFKGFFKKNKTKLIAGGGGIGAIFALLSLFFTAGLSIVNFKEVLVGDLNDQLAAMDIRSDHVFRTKFNTMKSGVCGKVSIRCKFSTMSKRQVGKFEKAGFTDIETDDRIGGRKRITSMTAPDGTKITDPKELMDLRKNNPKIRAAMNRVYNPLYYGLFDKVSSKVFGKNKTNKAKKVTGDSDDAKRKALKEATAGEKVGGSSGTLTDGNGEYVVDDDGNKIRSGEPGFDDIKEKNIAENGRLAEKASGGAGGKAVSKVVGSGLKGLSIVGVADTACTVYNTARAVSAAAKVARSIQLIQFAMIILNTADAIKAGEATSEDVEFIGNMLTRVDTREKIVNETSTITDRSDDNLSLGLVDNPFFGKAAFDSPGYRVAAYNEAPVLTSQSQQYMVGGGLVGTLSGVIDSVSSLIPGGKQNIRSTCKKVQNPWVRGVGLIVGLVSSIGPGVGRALASIGASATVGLALPFLESMAADIIAGTVISEDISGVEAGDATFSGTSALLGDMAQNRGLQPLSKENMQPYLAATNEVKMNIAAAEKYEAKQTPFDISNQYSFLGSTVRSLNPSVTKLKAGGASTLSGVSSLLSTAFSTLVPSVKASQVYNEDRFSQCIDEGYSDVGIDADVFCNVRYGLTARELAMDSMEVLDFMIDNNYIDEETGDPVDRPDNEYKKFIDNCSEREDGWGETSEENGSIGLECIDGHAETFRDVSYFRVYTVDRSINDGMEDEIESNTAANEGTPVTGGESHAAESVISSNYKAEHESYGLTNGFDYNPECVSVVKFFLRKFIDRNKFGTLGNGAYVTNTLKTQYGYTVDKTPAVYSIASWPINSPYLSAAAKPYGHTALVVDIYPDGSVQVIENDRDNKNGTQLELRKISATEAASLTYAHTEKDFKI